MRWLWLVALMACHDEAVCVPGAVEPCATPAAQPGLNDGLSVCNGEAYSVCHAIVTCDPMLQDCSGGDACFAARLAGAVRTFCAPPADYPCAPGSFLLRAGVCTPQCDPALELSNPRCMASETCQRLRDGVGICEPEESNE